MKQMFYNIDRKVRREALTGTDGKRRRCFLEGLDSVYNVRRKGLKRGQGRTGQGYFADRGKGAIGEDIEDGTGGLY